MQYKVIWNNGISSNIYKDLDSALLIINHLLQNNGVLEIKIEVINDYDTNKLKEYVEKLGIEEKELLHFHFGTIANCCEIIFNEDMTDYDLNWSNELDVYTTDHNLFSIFQKIEKNTNCKIIEICPEELTDGRFVIKLNNDKYYEISFDDPDDCK